MKWTIRVELTPDGNPPITYDIGTIIRPIADLSPEQIGLTLEEGQQLLRRIQVEIIASQAHAYALCRRACVDCGRPKRIKDIRTKCVQTVLSCASSRTAMTVCATSFSVARRGPWNRNLTGFISVCASSSCARQSSCRSPTKSIL